MVPCSSFTQSHQTAPQLVVAGRLQFDKEIKMSTMKHLVDLQQAVIQLHEIARMVERDIGKGELSESLRENADTLSALIRYSVI